VNELRSVTERLSAKITLLEQAKAVNTGTKN
jgi:hypothetical protein